MEITINMKNGTDLSAFLQQTFFSINDRNLDSVIGLKYLSSWYTEEVETALKKTQRTAGPNQVYMEEICDGSNFESTEGLILKISEREGTKWLKKSWMALQPKKKLSLIIHQYADFLISTKFFCEWFEHVSRVSLKKIKEQIGSCKWYFTVDHIRSLRSDWKVSRIQALTLSTLKKNVFELIVQIATLEALSKFEVSHYRLKAYIWYSISHFWVSTQAVYAQCLKCTPSSPLLLKIFTFIQDSSGFT